MLSWLVQVIVPLANEAHKAVRNAAVQLDAAALALRKKAHCADQKHASAKSLVSGGHVHNSTTAPEHVDGISILKKQVLNKTGVIDEHVGLEDAHDDVAGNSTGAQPTSKNPTPGGIITSLTKEYTKKSGSKEGANDVLTKGHEGTARGAHDETGDNKGLSVANTTNTTNTTKPVATHPPTSGPTVAATKATG